MSQCVNCNSQSQLHSITFNHVKSAISKLNGGKAAGYDGLMSDNLINGTDKLVVYISLYTTVLYVKTWFLTY